MQKIVLAAIATGLIATPVMASEHSCSDAPRDQWLSRDAVKARLSGMGYEVRRVKADDGCYEVEALAENGMKIRTRFDPVTGEMTRAGMADD